MEIGMEMRRIELPRQDRKPALGTSRTPVVDRRFHGSHYIRIAYKRKGKTARSSDDEMQKTLMDQTLVSTNVVSAY